MHSFFMRSTIQKYVAEAVREARGEQGEKNFPCAIEGCMCQVREKKRMNRHEDYV